MDNFLNCEIDPFEQFLGDLSYPIAEDNYSEMYVEPDGPFLQASAHQNQ